MLIESEKPAIIDQILTPDEVAYQQGLIEYDGIMGGCPGNEWIAEKLMHFQEPNWPPTREVVPSR